MANEDNQFSKKAVENSSKLTQDARTIKEEYKDLLGIKSKLNEYDKEAINLADKVQQSAKQNVVELGRTGDLNKEILKDRKLLLDLDRELLISTKNLGTDQQSQAKKLAETNIQRLFVLDQIENIQKELLDLDEIQQYLAVKELSNLSDQLSILENQTSQLIKQTDSDVQRLALAIQTREQQEKNIKAKKVESEVQDQINEKLGIAGNSLKLFNSFLGEAGKGFKFDKVSKDMEAFADEAVRSNKEVSRLQVLGVGVKSAFGNLKNNLTDPVVLIGAMVKGFQDLDKANKEFRQLTGQNVGAFETINTSLISGADYIKSSVKLSKELGVNVRAAFSKETLTEAAELTELMGLGAKETARLATLSKVTGTELKNTATSIETGFQSFVKTNKTAINFGDVMNDVGTASSALSLSLGSDAGKIANAAMEARKLGINLQQAEQIAESLLNFESSIESELEAELLTGKDINLEKARSAALNNDIATLSKEIASNSSINQSFSTGNRIQQEAIAKSLGMSREAMANMIYQQKIQNGLSTEQAAKAADISLEEAKRQTATEQINKAVEKLTQLLGLVLYPINLILSNSVALGLVFSTIAIATLPMLLKGVTSFVGGLKEGLSVAKDLGKKLLGMSPTKDIADKAGDSTGKAADKTKGIAGKSGDDVKNFLKGLASGLKAMSDGKVFKGALNLIPAAVGLTLMTAALPAILVLSIPGIGKSFQANMTGIAKGLSALGKALPDILLGSLALAAIGAAMIPLTYALSLLSPLVEAFGKVILSVFNGLATLVTAAADGFVKFLGAITFEKVAALFVLGGALVSLAAGFGTFAAAMGAAGIVSFFAGDGVLSQLGKLAEMATPLQTVANSLTQMAAGLSGVAVALNQIDEDKLESLNEFAEVSPLAAVGNAIGGAIEALFGGGEEKQSSPELAEIKDILSQILKKETHIYLDSTKVGTGFSMASSKLQ
jgi:hypothetical protein